MADDWILTSDFVHRSRGNATFATIFTVSCIYACRNGGVNRNARSGFLVEGECEWDVRDSNEKRDVKEGTDFLN